MSSPKTACFFSHEDRAQLQKEQYSVQDIRILSDLGFKVTIATTFNEIPWNCDLYFSWWTSGSVLPLIKARLLRKPIMVVAGGNDSMFYRDSLSGVPRGYLAAPWYKKLATRLSLRFATATIVVSRHMVDDAKRLGAREPVVVPNSIDTRAFRPSEEQKQYVTTIFNLYPGVVELKRGEIFLRSIPFVLESYPDQTFVVIGEKGQEYQRLQVLCSRLEIADRVRFIGSIHNLEVATWLQRSRVHVQISDTETFGVALAEAMSTGTPVVVSRRGAIPDLVGDHGVFVDHNSPQSVAAGIVSLLAKTDEERRTLGEALRSRIVEHFSYEKRREAIQRIIAGILSPEILPR